MTGLIVFRDDVTIKFDETGVAFTPGARDFKGVQAVAYSEEANDCILHRERSDEPRGGA